MVLLGPLVLLFASRAAAAEPLKDKIDREYVQPVFRELQGALDGREAAWTPPVLPGSAQAAALSEKVRTLWLEPLMETDQGYAFSAARSLASPKVFEPPAAPDLGAILPNGASPEADDLVSSLSRRFLSRLFPADYALGAAAALGSSRQGDGPAAPELSGLAKPDSIFGSSREGTPRARCARRGDFAPRRKVSDSTSLARGSAGAAGRPRLKPFHPDLPPASP